MKKDMTFLNGIAIQALSDHLDLDLEYELINNPAWSTFSKKELENERAKRQELFQMVMDFSHGIRKLGGCKELEVEVELRRIIEME